MHIRCTREGAIGLTPQALAPQALMSEFLPVVRRSPIRLINRLFHQGLQTTRRGRRLWEKAVQRLGCFLAKGGQER